MVKKPLFTVTDKQRKNYVCGSVSDFVLLYNTKVYNELERIKLTYKDQPKTGFKTSIIYDGRGGRMEHFKYIL